MIRINPDWVAAFGVRVPKANDATLAGLILSSGPSPGVANAIGNAGLNDEIPLGYPKRVASASPCDRVRCVTSDSSRPGSFLPHASVESCRAGPLLRAALVGKGDAEPVRVCVRLELLFPKSPSIGGVTRSGPAQRLASLAGFARCIACLVSNSPNKKTKRR